jgi:imidazolonepropionase
MGALGVIENGAVVIRDGIIEAVGPSEIVLAGRELTGSTVLDASGKAVLPGFVDSHTHLVFAGFRAEEFGWRLAGMRYLDILERGGGILSTVAATRAADIDALTAGARRRLETLLSFGVTTVEGKSGYGLDRDTELRQLEVMRRLNAEGPVEVVPTFLGAHAVPPEFRGNPDGYVSFICDQVLPAVVNEGLAEFCDVFCEKGVFSLEQSRRLLTRARGLGLGLKLHADEIVPLGGAELAAELGAVSADHLLHASQTGIAGLARSGTVMTLLPATAFGLREPFAPARAMIDAGGAVALATDLNPGSSFTESIPLLLGLAVLQMGLSPEEAVTALTLNGAAAVGRADRIGSLEVGKQGDLVILEFPSYRFLPYHLGSNSVERVIKRGRLVYDRRAAERAALGATHPS